MDYEEKSQLPAIGQNTGKVTGKMSANNGIERVRKARERYNRQQRGSGCCSDPLRECAKLSVCAGR